MPNKVMEHTFTYEETCDDQKTQQDARNNQVADIDIACFVAAPGLVARPTAPIHDDLCPPFTAHGQEARAETLVIPAKAGIQSVANAFPKVRRVDSRFRGNDCGFERPCLANDTSTPALRMVTYSLHLGIVKWQQRPAFQTCGESPNPNAADAENRRPVHPVKLGT